MKHQLESRLLGEILITSDTQITPSLRQKMKIMASGSTTSWEIDGQTVETVSDFIFWGSKITADGETLDWKKHKLESRLPG